MIKRFFAALAQIAKEIYYCLEWFIRFIVFHKKKCEIAPVNAHVVVVGNGPSVNGFDFDLAKHNQFDFLCVNYFALREELFFDLRPRYYCIIDPCFYDNTQSEKPLDRLRLEEILMRVNWEMILISLHQQKFKTDNSHIKNVTINSYQYRGNWDSIRYWLYKNNIGSYSYQNVMNAALYYLITAKAASVYLIGVENDWHRELYVNASNDVFREVQHFYGSESINLIEKGEINRGELYKYFYWYYITLRSHYEASRYAKFQKVPIYNCSSNSYIDVFEKISWGSSI